MSKRDLEEETGLDDAKRIPWGQKLDRQKIEICKLYRGRFLDIGCLTRLYELFCPGEYVGFDRFLFDENKKPDALGDACHLPFKDECIDVVLAFDVIEHLTNGHLFVSECFRVLRSNGKLLITTPNGPKSPFAKMDETHVSIYTPKKLKKILEASNFDVRFNNLFYIHSPLLKPLKKLPHFLGEWLASKFVWNIFVIARKRV
jgi:SAM-dependent methyltransferase